MRAGQKVRIIGGMLLALAANLGAARADDEAAEPAGEVDAAGAGDEGNEGLVVRMGTVTASFRFFGDVGAAYDDLIDSADGAKGSFLAGSFDFFTAVRLNDHLRILSEIVAEFEEDTNEVGFELERLWAMWSKNDAFYVKLGREHSPVNRWNRVYHHGRIFWPAVTQPFLARFEDQGGPLPIHASGVELGGTVRTRAGALTYVGGISNGRGADPTTVENVADANDSKAWDAGGYFTPAGLPGLTFGGNYHSDQIPPDPTTPLAPDTDEQIVSVFWELRAGRWEAISEAATIDHETPGQPAYDHASAYLQVNLTLDRCAPYGRIDARHMDEGDPFYAPSNLDLDRWDALLGVRFDLGEQAALKVEGGFARAEQRDALGAVTTGSGPFGSLGLQWVF